MTQTFEEDSLIERAKAVARMTLEGKYDALLACRDLAGLRAGLPNVSEEIMDVFVGVASEVDGLPIGAERQHWSTESLSLKDIEVAEYRELTKAVVEEALEKLLMSLSTKH